MRTALQVGDIHSPDQNNTGRIELVKQDTVDHHRQLPCLAFRSIFLFHLVKWASDAWLDGSKWFEMRRWELLPDNLRQGCVITMGDLGNAEVDQIFHIGGLKDLQAICKCRADPTGTHLLGLGIPADVSEEGSPHSEEWLFTKTALSQDDLNNKNIVIFTVKWPRLS